MPVTIPPPPPTAFPTLLYDPIPFSLPYLRLLNLGYCGYWLYLSSHCSLGFPQIMKHKYTLLSSVPMPSSLCKFAVYLVLFIGALFIANLGLRAPVSSTLGFLAGVKSKGNFHAYQQISSRPNNETLNEERAKAIRDAFIFAYNGYWETCKGQDELLPNSNTCGNPRYAYM